ncbi:MAG TPA: helix-turn-helix domain-containing protein [Candidatus Binataceae bacterium]|nr:helix-turn-helix domain-containing protein [Candidatus Binataceae bacterium]
MTSATRITGGAIVTKAKPTRSDRRMVRNRKALLNAAEKLIAEKGLEHVTIDEIAETADLAKGTFYNYFDDKNEIAKELAVTIRREIRDQVGVAEEGIDDSAGQLVAGIAVCLRAAAVSPTRAGVLGRMYSLWLSPDTNKEFLLLKDLEVGYRTKRFSVGDVPVGIVMVVGTVQAGIMRALELGEWNAIRKLTLALSELILRALGLKSNEAQAIPGKIVARVFGRNFAGLARRGL